MVSSITDSRTSNFLAAVSQQPTTPSGSKDSFTAQLTSALEGYLAQSGNSSNLEIEIQATQSQDSGTRQFLVTVKDPNSSPGQSTAGARTAATPPAGAGSATPADSGSPATPSTETFPGFASIPSGASAAAATDTTGSTGGRPGATSRGNAPMAAATTPMTEADAYWAAQPPAVQQLRNITDFAQRSDMAQQLADQGYTIDKAIMVWGWDPLKTMLTRQMYGYTWAPSMKQGNVSTPGITLLGQTPYDPNSPPSGSIAVNTDFAKGTEVTDPWCASQLKANT